MVHITQALVLLLLALLCSSYPVSGLDCRSNSDDLSINAISSTDSPISTGPDTTPSSGNDGSRHVSGTSDQLGGIDGQSLGVQLGSGFIVGCVIGALGYAAYRVISRMIWARRRGRRSRASSFGGEAV